MLSFLLFFFLSLQFPQALCPSTLITATSIMELWYYQPGTCMLNLLHPPKRSYETGSIFIPILQRNRFADVEEFVQAVEKPGLSATKVRVLIPIAKPQSCKLVVLYWGVWGMGEIQFSNMFCQTTWD